MQAQGIWCIFKMWRVILPSLTIKAKTNKITETQKGKAK